eukprot:CAMPEP_0197196440 /NCGR_PEP_ID=MMETSP1423-20130617/32357_1 /TAXON_ID=476441 /ORGANISM="Pseudo-nitzschia heimii, Strain UNC1101" /LENGTH=507 /DNA_ID=CAMNT_0042650239 /DNA_START=501 /DNA_END=2022 /DNA_ORIENTATION=+
MKLSISAFLFVIEIYISICIGYVTASSEFEKREFDASKRRLNLRAHLQVREVDSLTPTDDFIIVDGLMQADSLAPRSTCHPESAIRNNDLTVAGMVCAQKNQHFLGHLCSMIKTSPPIYNLLNNTFNATDLNELDKIPGFNLTTFEALVDQFTSEEGVPQFTVFAPDNAALREFARQTINYLFDLRDPQIMLFIEKSQFDVNSDQMIDTFILSRQGRMCRDAVALNHIAIGGRSFDDLDCGDRSYMLGGDSTITQCNDLHHRRNLQFNQQSNLRIGTSKSQFGMGNLRNNLDVKKKFTQPRIIDPDYLVSNGFVHVVNNVCLPIVETKIVYQTITAIEYADIDYVTVFKTCDCPEEAAASATFTLPTGSPTDSPTAFQDGSSESPTYEDTSFPPLHYQPEALQTPGSSESPTKEDTSFPTFALPTRSPTDSPTPFQDGSTVSPTDFPTFFYGSPTKEDTAFPSEESPTYEDSSSATFTLPTGSPTDFPTFFQDGSTVSPTKEDTAFP